MFQIKKGVSLSLDDLAKLHWENLQRAKTKFSFGSLPYERDSIIRRVERIRKISKGKQLIFINDLSANNYDLLRKIIISKPETLNRISTKISKRIGTKIYPQLTFRSNKSNPKQFGDYIEEIFDYDLFSDKKRYWNAYELSKRLGVDVCVYCNRNYIYTLTKGKSYYVRPEFDHFIPKRKNPFFAISFYNLIPSCHICNSNLKRDIDFKSSTHLHPYLASLDATLKFTVEFTPKTKFSSKTIQRKFGVMFFMDKVDNFELKLVKRSPLVSNLIYRKAINNCGVFKLNELYNCHKDLVTEMILNTVIYSDSKINELLKDFGGTLFNSRDDVMRHITKNFHIDTDMPKRPFSKLVKDVHKEFGLRY